MMTYSPVPYESILHQNSNESQIQSKKVALFLDVDNTLTDGYIQEFFASMLGCKDEYREIEADFQNDRISADDFGARIIDIFREHKFTRSIAEQYAPHVPLQGWAHGILSRRDVDAFLISSGPNYFVEWLAERYGIPIERTCSSQYHFSRTDNLIQRCDALSTQGKAEFVRRNAETYLFSIGVGDSEELDGPFITNCTFAFLTNPSRNFFYSPSFELIGSFVDRLISHINELQKNDTGGSDIDVSRITMGQIIKSLTPRQAYSVIAVICIVGFLLIQLGIEIGDPTGYL